MENPTENSNGADKVQDQAPKPSPRDFFKSDRGERETYMAAALTDTVLLPLTYDGYEAFIERACKQFTPALPIDDSIRKVFCTYVHHIASEVNTTTIEAMGKVLWKSLTNALTWEIDQEVKAKARVEIMAAQAKAQAAYDEQKKQEAIAKREMKSAKRSAKKGKRVTINETKNS